MRKALTNMLKKAQRKKPEITHDIKQALSKNKACYVLITCGEPSIDGKMEVEMTYEGDASLAAYLIESARGFIDQDEPS